MMVLIRRKGHQSLQRKAMHMDTIPRSWHRVIIPYALLWKGIQQERRILLWWEVGQRVIKIVL